MVCMSLPERVTRGEDDDDGLMRNLLVARSASSTLVLYHFSCESESESASIQGLEGACEGGIQGVTTFFPRRIPAKQKEIRATDVRQASSYGDPLGELVVITWLKSKLLFSGSLTTQTLHQRQLL